MSILSLHVHAALGISCTHLHSLIAEVDMRSKGQLVLGGPVLPISACRSSSAAAMAERSSLFPFCFLHLSLVITGLGDCILRLSVFWPRAQLVYA